MFPKKHITIDIRPKLIYKQILEQLCTLERFVSQYKSPGFFMNNHDVRTLSNN